MVVERLIEWSRDLQGLAGKLDGSLAWWLAGWLGEGLGGFVVG